MNDRVKQDWSFKALQNAGYIGAIQVDYRENKVRGSGRSGAYYCIIKKRMANGVALDDLDRVYHPSDLEHILEMRASFRKRGGLFENKFRLKNPFSDGYAHVRCLFKVTVDPFGFPILAEGALFDATSLTYQPSSASGSVVSLSEHIASRKTLLGDAKRANFVCTPRLSWGFNGRGVSTTDSADLSEDAHKSGNIG